MSRLFDGNDLIRFSVPASGGPDWRYGTILRIVRIMTATDLSWQSGVEIENSAGAIRAAFGRRANGNLYFANDAGINDAVPVEDGDGWMLQAVTKAAGTVAPVMHKVIISSGTRTSTALGTTFADSPSSASGFIKLGGDDDPASERLSVVVLMPGIVLTTTQIDAIVAAKTTQSIADLCDANCLLADDSNGFATDLIGGLTATITGTTDDADDPAGWVYGLGGGTTRQAASWQSSYVVHGRAQASWASSYVTRTRGQASWQSSAVTRARGGAQWTSSYSTHARSTATWASSYVVANRATGNWTSSYTVAVRGGSSWASSYTVRARTPQAWESSYVTRARPTAAWASSYTVNVTGSTRESANWTSSYVVVGRMGLSWQSSWTTRTSAAMSWQASYSVRARGSATWSLSYAVRARSAVAWASSYAVGDLAVGALEGGVNAAFSEGGMSVAHSESVGGVVALIE